MFAFVTCTISEVEGRLNAYIPTTEYAEFPCSVTYELYGETKTAKDVIVCEYAGSSYSVGGEQHRKWKEYLKSGKEDLVLEDVSDKNMIDNYGNKILYVCFDYGNGAYHMGDKETSPEAPQDMDIIYYISERDAKFWERGYYKGKKYLWDWYYEEEALEKLGIKLISFECAPPIENEFVKR